jgi:transposase
MPCAAVWTGNMRFRLELTDPGFDQTVLSEFRTRLVALTAEERFLEAVLALCKERGWLKTRGRQRTDRKRLKPAASHGT